MTFPESPRVVYKSHTLNKVVCQLNFPPILAIGAQPPADLQDRLRESYPLYQSVAVRMPLPLGGGAPPELASILSQLPIMQPGQGSMQHRFTTADETLSITLGPQLLAVEASAYDQWRSFRAAVETAKRAVEETYRPAFYTRVGLRYQNVVDRATVKDGAQWTDAINSTLLGLLGAAESGIAEAVEEINSTELVKLDHMEHASLRIQHGLAQAEGESDTKVVYLIDSEFFTDTRQEGSAVYELLDYFNTEAGRLFRWIITDDLRDALGVRDDPPARPG